ncbi:recombinase family protein [Candidatus Azobacteroides pseudotrichonymphae]|uniref:Serine site-specific recombinase n=1 Tax=Azobacteroides pseudotrichonymphae genomovar. CFP2 TaxID=511995 RepID=B6YRW4_AZOPC|nr:recombinase family protein [Candidatus Azobacteroides pseudotrichonymphae]BAG83936.1 serine site-specific recombinase [Candidatus Azobacteroides pseudotrichonymphae genomovar. CFP2]
MNVVYLRVSTCHQDVNNQMMGIEKYMEEHQMTIDRVIEETVSGKIKARDRKLASVMDELKKGDTLIVSEVSRIGRNMMDVISNINMLCNEKGCNFIAVKQNYYFKTNDLNSKVMLFAHTIAAEIERDLNCARTRESYLRVKAESNGDFVWGRPKDSGKKLVINPYLSIDDIARQNNVHRRTVTRYVRQYRKDLCYKPRNHYLTLAQC